MLKSNDRTSRSAKPQVCQRGEACSHAVLTAAIVRQIRQMYIPNRFGSLKIVRALAGKGIVVKRKTVENVLQGRSWRDVA